MALRRTATAAIPLAIVVGFAAGVAVDRYVLPTTVSQTGTAGERGESADDAASAISKDGLPLAAQPTKPPASARASDSAAVPSAASASNADRVPAGEPPKSVAEAVQSLEQALRWGKLDDERRRGEGERAAAFLEASANRDDRVVALALAKWLVANGRTPEATRRVLAGIGRRTPTLIEIGWLSEVDPRAGVAAARTLVERRPGSPEAFESLAESLIAAGDTAGAFDAYAAALRAGLSPNNGASDLARLDPERAISVLVELYAARDVGAGARALVEAYLRAGRVADARRELVRLVTSQDGTSGLLEAAAILEPEATAKALAPQMDDLAAATKTDRSAVAAYGAALARAGHRAEALVVLRAVAESTRDDDALAAMLRCDPIAARAYVEAHLPAMDDTNPHPRIRVLGMLGRRDEATALFDRWAASYATAPEEWAGLVYAAPDRAIAGLRQGAEKVRGSDPETEWRVSLAHAFEAAGRIAEAKAAWADVPDRVLDLEALAEKAALR